MPYLSYRRFFAFCYDLLILAAILFTITGIVVTILSVIYSTESQPFFGNKLWFQAALCLVIWGYFHISFKRGGQTIGMKAWRIKRVSLKQAFGWQQTVILCFASFSGLAILNLLFSPHKSCLTDKISQTHVEEVR